MAYIGQAPTKVPLTSADIADGTIALADIATNQIDETLMKDAFVGDFSDVTVTAADAFLYGDATDSGNTKKDTVQGVLDLVSSTDNASASFQGYLTSNVTNAVGGGTVYNITATAWTERIDVGGDFNAANGTFTAPSTGKYFLSALILVGGIDTAHTYYQAYITTSNFTYRFDHADLDSGFSGTACSQGSVVADMDASDTAYLTYTLTGSSTGTANINGGTGGCFFSGFLIG